MKLLDAMYQWALSFFNKRSVKVDCRIVMLSQEQIEEIVRTATEKALAAAIRRGDK